MKHVLILATALVLTCSMGCATQSISRPEAQYKEFEWTYLRQERVKMISKDQGFCYLSGVGGQFAGGAENVRVYLDEKDGYWYLEGHSNQFLIAHAIAVIYR